MITIGIDVCMGKKCVTIANTQEALKKLFKDVEQQDTRILMEATGRYHLMKF